MRLHRAVVAFIVLACLLVGFPSRLPAPIFGFCQNLDDALAKADTVAVIRILESPNARRQRAAEGQPYDPAKLMGGMNSGIHDDFQVYVVRTLKGNLPDSRIATLALRFINCRTLPAEEGERIEWHSLADDHSTTATLHLAFLTAVVPGGPTPWGQPISASAFSLDCTDSVLPLHPLTRLEGATATHDGLLALFQESLELYKGTPGEWGARSLVVWCDKPRECASPVPTAAGTPP